MSAEPGVSPVTAVGDAPARTLRVAASGTLLVLAVFSAFVVTVGASTHSLGAGIAGQAWSLSGMSLGLAAALLTAGVLADDLGYARVLTWSAGLLGAASVVGAVAPNIGVLIAARVVQGVAGGGVVAASLGAIGRTFPSGGTRTRATAVWGAAVGAGITVGPLTAGVLDAALGWRSGFWLEAAGALAVMTAAAGLRMPPASTRRPLDVTGVTALVAGMALLTGGLVEAHHGWSRPVTVLLVGSAGVVLAAFMLLESRRRCPMLDPRLFTQPRFVASVAGALFVGLSVIGLMSYAPTLLQRGLGLSAIGSAGVLAAWSATSTVVALAARSLPARIGSEARLAAGLGLAAIGEVALTGLHGGTGWRELMPGMFVAGIGSGIANAALARIAVESVPHARVGMGSGANNTARYLGGAAGVALVVTLGSASGAGGPVEGFDRAALVSAALCALGALIVLASTKERRT
ncbi:MAG TPA: MFS transporter [Solirubrobacteraceae bacterium]|nr:MFS transporter [Solirubrobacteraceae bacterium]